ncbi:hypothetical protein Taro_009417, partial [Colocasia esculenta]|nr:hypothetical protein [Colocasia esculenta]
MDMIHRGTMDMTHRGTMDMIQAMVPLEVANRRQECMGGFVNLNFNFYHFHPVTVMAQYPLLMLRYRPIMAMVQKGETPPGIKEINDMPPNPNQQPSNPRLVPRAK